MTTMKTPSVVFSKRIRAKDRIIVAVLFMAALIPILATIGIVATLIIDTVRFFQSVPIQNIFSRELAPLRAEPSFGLLPLINGTLMTTLMAILVAGPLGLSSALYLSELTSEKKRRIIKPIIEIVAGIPTIVYGFFAYSYVTPLLMKIIPGLNAKNALSAGLVMGVMIIPMIASLSEDAMHAVPDALREGAYALGSTKAETSLKVVMPAASSGIIAAFVLGISRAVGETMIVTIASGSSKRFTFDVKESMQTMTSYIVELVSGDVASGTAGYYSLYAVGFLLFIFTLLMNLIAQSVARRPYKAPR